MTERTIPCPICKSDAHSFKVSRVYMESLMRVKHRENAQTPTLDKLLEDESSGQPRRYKGNQFYHEMVSTFQPPQAGAPVMRSVNPDWVAVGLAILSVYFLYQIYMTQYAIFWYILAFAVLAFAGYIIFHKQFIARYTLNKTAETGLKTNVEKGIDRWMKLYYCSKDGIVYGDRKDQYIALDQMTNYLMK